MDARGKLNLQSSVPRLLNLSAADIWGPIILSGGRGGAVLRCQLWRNQEGEHGQQAERANPRD